MAGTEEFQEFASEAKSIVTWRCWVSNLLESMARFVRGSIENVGLDPNDLPESGKDAMTFGSDREKKKAWKDIWGAGQGVGSIDSVLPTAEIVERLENEYRAARTRIAG